MIDPKDLTQAICRLPALPAAASKLMQLVQDPDSEVREIVRTIESDPALAMALLRLCNSAALGVGRNVQSIQAAVVLLGRRQLTQLVASAQFQGLLGAEQDGYGLLPGGLWRHSIGTALAANQLADLTAHPEPSTLFTAGLLHDIGKLALDAFVHQDYSEIARRVQEEGLSFPEAERAVLGCDQSEAGARLAEHWKLPEVIVRVIRMHHQPNALDPPDATVDLVHLADAVCTMVGITYGESSDGLAYRICPIVTKRAGLKRSDLDSLAIEIVAQVKEVEQWLGTETTDQDKG